MINRDSYLMYKSFIDAIHVLNNSNEELKLIYAISDYSFYESEPASLEGPTLAIWLLIKPQLDANIRKYENGIKGGCPKGTKKPSMKGNKNASRKGEQNQDETKTKPNDNINLNANLNDNSFSEETETTPLDSSSTTQPDNEESEFKAWLSDNFPKLSKLKEPLTLAQYNSLCEKFGKEIVLDKMQSFENVDYRGKTYSSAYKTIYNWCKKELNLKNK